MKLFNCDCQNRPALFFENTKCGSCHRLVAFDAGFMDVGPFEQSPDGTWVDSRGNSFKLCGNQTLHEACNWVIPVSDAASLCAACRMNTIIPDLTIEANLEAWKILEAAKRRCMFTLLSLRVPTQAGDGAPGLSFKFAADHDSRTHFERPLLGTEPVMTGHEDGLVTINLAEADTVARSRIQSSMSEEYRTPLGHFRHETGHYAWDRLAARDDGFAQRSRDLFGDERADYGQALSSYYENGPQKDWSTRFVSAYASSHPFEDWAETWSHYLHMTDTLEVYAAFAATHLGVNSIPSKTENHATFEGSLQRWYEVTVMMNSLNRSMGLPDAYPFVITPQVSTKLSFIDREVRRVFGAM